MCGITGYFLPNTHENSDLRIKRMLKSIHHRGPDDNGFALFDTSGNFSLSKHNLALANARLSIIDVSSAGHQPMYSDDKRYCIVYNGEIFNYIELRDKLKAKGREFKTNTDTEVVLKAYEEYGIDFLSHLNGMWALALYDTQENTLLLSRDRFGIKPLFFSQVNGAFIFGSEIKCIREAQFGPLSVNDSLVLRNIVYSLRFVENEIINKKRATYYNEVEQLLPAEYMIIDLNTNSKTIKKFWNVNLSKQIEYKNEKEIIEKFKELLINSVSIRLRSDVPYTFALSGGMDSAAIISIAKKVLDKDVASFSAIYEKGNRYDEQEYIAATVEDLKIPAHYVKPQLGDFFDNLRTMLKFHDEPICTVTWYMHWDAMKAIKEKGYTVVMEGFGADEILAGYYDHYRHNFYDLQKQGKTELLKHEVDCWIKNHSVGGRDRKKEYEIFKEKVAKSDCYYEQDVAPNHDKYSKLIKEDFKHMLASFNEVKHPELNSSMLTSRMYNELIHEGVPVSLRPDDRNSMAFSVESRSPFLDHRLVEFCYSLPNNLKIRDGVGKYILREALRGILNEKVRARTEKVGFNAPFYEWLSGPLQEQVNDMLSNSNLHIYKYIDREKLLKCWREHLDGSENHMMLLWNVISIELWLEMQVNHE